MQKTKKISEPIEIITCDLHIGINSDSWMTEYQGIQLPSKVAETFRQFDAIIDRAIKLSDDGYNVTLNIFGDITNTSRPIPLYARMLIERFNFLEESEIRTIIFKGNHEESVANEDALSPLAAINYKHVRFITKITAVTRGKLNWIYIPHISKAKFGEDATDEMVTQFITEKVLKLIDKDKRNIIGAHIHAAGAAVGSEQLVIRGGINFLNGKKIKAFVDWMFAGHIHKHQDFMCNGIRTVYPGSLTRIDFGEEKEAKGHVEYYPRSDKYEFIENDTTEYKTVRLDFVTKGTIDLDESKIKKIAGGKIVKLLFKVSEENRNKINYNEIESAFAKHCFVSRIEKKVFKGNKEESPVTAEISPQKALYAYVKESTTIPKELKKEIHSRALTVLEGLDNAEESIITSMGKMILEGLTLKNFRCFTDSTIEIRDNKVFGIIGEYNHNNKRSNGSGKTTLLMAIFWILFDKYKQIPDDNLITRGKDEMSGTVIFKAGKDRIKITRAKRRKKSSTLELSINGDNKSGRVRETQEMIENIIGMNADLFMNTIFFPERNSDGFCATTPTSRKEYLIDLLQLDIWDEGHEEVKAVYREEERECNKIETIYNEMKTNMDSFNLTKSQNSLTILTNAISSLMTAKDSDNKKLQKIIQDSSQYDDLKSQVEDIDEEIDEDKEGLEEEEEHIKEGKDSLKEIKKGLKKCLTTVEIEKMESKINTISKIQNEQELILKTNRRRLKSLSKSDVCMMCENKMSPEYKKKLIAKLVKNNEAIEFIIEGQEEKLEIAEEKLSKGKKERLIQTGLTMKISTAQDKLTSNTKSRDKLLLSIEKLKDKKSKLKLRISKAKKSNPEKEKIEKRIKDAEEHISEKNIEMGRLKKTVSDYKKNKASLIKKKKELKNSQDELSILSLILQIFSKGGVSSYIISQSLGEIESYANEILEDIDSGEKRIIFKTDKEVGKSKSKRIKDTLDIFIEDANGFEGSYEEYSNGEGTTVNFSIRLALSKILSKRNNVWNGIIILDEIFGPLDEYNKDQMVKVINMLKKEFSQIFVISHTDIKDSFDDVIYIIKDKKKNTSKIKLLA